MEIILNNTRYKCITPRTEPSVPWGGQWEWWNEKFQRWDEVINYNSKVNLNIIFDEEKNSDGKPKKISITKIRKKLSAMYVNYEKFATLQKLNDFIVLLTITSRDKHDDNATLALGILDEDYYVKSTHTPNELYVLTAKY